jgi:uncharacterized membrane protein
MFVMPSLWRRADACSIADLLGGEQQVPAGPVPLDDRARFGAFQSIDEAITNPLFLATFVGVLVVTGVAAVLHVRQDGRSVLPWTVAVFILYLAVFVITVRVNVPLNDEIKDAGDPDRIADLAAVRERFDEAKWVRWNIVRR